MRRLSLSEKHSSVTKLNVSIGLKLTIARFINSSLILLIINFDVATQWFDRAGMAYDATVLMMCMAFIDPVVYFISPPTLIKWYKIRKEK